MENVLTKSTDPAIRCQSLMSGGKRQCMYERMEGSKYCSIHGGISDHKKIEQTKIRNYRLQQYQRRVNELADSEGVKSLREEIGILRLILEEIINKCKDSDDLLLYSGKIADISSKIERLVVSCHKLESSLGYMMDKQAVLNISTQIVNVIGVHIKDQTVLDAIVEDIVTTIDSN